MKHYKIISANAEKHFGKTQHTLKIKNLGIVGIEKNLPQSNKGSHGNPQLISFNGEGLMFPRLDQE